MLHRSRGRESVKEIGNSITYLVTYAIFPIKFLNICVFPGLFPEFCGSVLFFTLKWPPLLPT